MSDSAWPQQRDSGAKTRSDTTEGVPLTVARWFLAWLRSLLARYRAAGSLERSAAAAARAALTGQALRSSDPAYAVPLRSPFPPRYWHHAALIALVCLAVAMSRARLGDSWPGGNAPIVAPSVAPDPSLVRTPPVAGAVEPAPETPALDDRVVQRATVYTSVHRLTEGETLASVAARYGVSVSSIFWANDLNRREFLPIGLELRIPRLSGVPYVAQPGDSVASIARHLGVSSAAIRLLPANRLASGEPQPGQILFVPGGERPYPADLLDRLGGVQALDQWSATAVAGVREDETNLRAGPGTVYGRVGQLNSGQALKLVARHEDWIKVETAEISGWVRTDLLRVPRGVIENVAETNDIPAPPPIWVWPTRGTITSTFGWRSAPFRSFHNGLDIANAAWTKIYAARAGTVVEAGWCSGFGYCVKINHGEGIQTIYGHMIKRPPVSAGERVAAGDLIGYMGSTYDRAGGGYSTGVHLHFTVKVNGTAVDPRRFLP